MREAKTTIDIWRGREGGYVSLRHGERGTGAEESGGQRGRGTEKNRISRTKRKAEVKVIDSGKEIKAVQEEEARAFSHFELSSSPPRSDARNVCSRARVCSVSVWSMHYCVRMQTGM
jgi:hypothetical protein